jgi:Acyl-CoA synthetases (AMP-forming)/AMP-acid ligases II
MKIVTKRVCLYRGRGVQKLSYWHNTGTEPLSSLTLGQVIDIAVERWGDKVAFVSLYQGHSITYREARDKVGVGKNIGSMC